jgi:hypothetical protein
MLVVYSGIGIMGIFMGIMGTDSCRGVEEYAVVYLFFIWPLILFFMAITPPVLFFFRASTLAIILSLVGGFLIAGASFAFYMPILGMACRPITNN